MLNIFVVMYLAKEFKTWNAAQLVAYKLVMEPGPDILLHLKDELAKEELELNFTNPEIILSSFQAKEEMEATLVRWLQRICNLQGAFLVTLNNYGGLPPHNIHVRIQDKEEIIKMISQLKMLDHFIQSNGCPPAILQNSPQLDIIKNLPENIYPTILNQFSGRCFHDSFIAEKIKLYKRHSVESPYQLVYAFSLPADSKF
jgi:hypothetical protein